MSESHGDGIRPVRLALVLTLFILPGAGVALLLWHDVVNRVLSGQPMEVSVWAALGLVAALALVVWVLALYLRRLVGDGSP